MVKKIFNKKIFLIYFVLVYINVQTFFAAVRFQPLKNNIKKNKTKDKRKDKINNNNNNLIVNSNERAVSGNNNIPEDNDIQNKNNIIHNNNIDNDIQNDNNIQDNQLGNNIDNSDHDVNSEIDNDDDKKTAQMVLLRYIWVSFFLHHLLNNGYNDKLLLEKYKIKLNKDNLYSIYEDSVGANLIGYSTYDNLSTYLKKVFYLYTEEEKKILPFKKVDNKESSKKVDNKESSKFKKNTLGYSYFIKFFLSYIYDWVKKDAKMLIVYNYLNKNITHNSDEEYMWVFTLFFGYYVFNLVVNTITVQEEINSEFNFEDQKTFNIFKNQFYLKKLHESLLEKYDIYINYLNIIINKFSCNTDYLKFLISKHRENCINNKYFVEYFTNIYYRPAVVDGQNSYSYMDCFYNYIREN